MAGERGSRKLLLNSHICRRIYGRVRKVCKPPPFDTKATFLKGGNRKRTLRRPPSRGSSLHVAGRTETNLNIQRGAFPLITQHLVYYLHRNSEIEIFD